MLVLKSRVDYSAAFLLRGAVEVTAGHLSRSPKAEANWDLVDSCWSVPAIHMGDRLIIRATQTASTYVNPSFAKTVGLGSDELLSC